MVISERFVICRGRKKWFKIWSLGVYGQLRKKWGQCSWNFSLLSITARDIWVASLCTKSENLKLFSSWIIFIWSKHHFNQIWSKSYHVEHTSSCLITAVKQLLVNFITKYFSVTIDFVRFLIRRFPLSTYSMHIIFLYNISVQFLE